MRAGLEALPWMIRKKPSEPGPFECESCKIRNPIEIRRSFHCGFLSQAEWVHVPAEFPSSYGGLAYSCDLCPGWTSTLPEVNRICEAYGPYDKGCLASFFPDPEDDLCHGLQVLAGAWARYEMERIKELETK